MRVPLRGARKGFGFSKPTVSSSLVIAGGPRQLRVSEQEAVRRFLHPQMQHRIIWYHLEPAKRPGTKITMHDMSGQELVDMAKCHAKRVEYEVV